MCRSVLEAVESGALKAVDGELRFRVSKPPMRQVSLTKSTLRGYHDKAVYKCARWCEVYLTTVHVNCIAIVSLLQAFTIPFAPSYQCHQSSYHLR